MFITVVSLLVFCACEQKTSEPKHLEIDETLIDLMMTDYNQENVPGAAILIVHQSNIILSKGYGLAKINEGTKINNQTNFRLASITKQFTAMAIMILKQRGQLNYEQTLTEFFDGFPTYGSSITVRHLMNHTSGLIDYFSLIPDTTTEQLKDLDVLELMRLQTTTYFVTGSEYRYSNSGYALLALIVETISGLSFAEFLDINIFTPLGMNGSIAFEEGISTIDNRAFGHSYNNNEYILDDQSLTSAVLGDGGTYTSIQDLYKWDLALNNSNLIDQDIIVEAFTPGRLNNGEEIDYGFGWVLDSYRGKERTYHTGSTRGFKNVYQRYPELELSISILTNRSSGNPMTIANQIADILFNNI